MFRNLAAEKEHFGTINEFEFPSSTNPERFSGKMIEEPLLKQKRTKPVEHNKCFKKATERRNL